MTSVKSSCNCSSMTLRSVARPPPVVHPRSHRAVSALLECNGDLYSGDHLVEPG